jgi:hypothetical protein
VPESTARADIAHKQISASIWQQAVHEDCNLRFFSPKTDSFARKLLSSSLFNKKL